jgi:DNA polymerase III delta prime subunit
MNITIDDSFKPVYANLQRSLPHASLLYGKQGVGLFTIAKSLVPIDVSRVIIDPAQKTKTSLPNISIERIRDLYDEVKTNANQAVIIDDADKMTEAAQNALLKLLEEPNSYTTFILTSHHPEQLLPTIRSRVQAYHVPPVSGDAILKQIESTSNFTAAKKQQVIFLASGLPAELWRLTNDDSYFMARSSQIQLAKALINESPYGIITALAKEKPERKQAIKLIEDSIQLLSLSPTESSVKKIKRLIEASQAIENGGIPRLHLLQAML